MYQLFVLLHILHHRRFLDGSHSNENKCVENKLYRLNNSGDVGYPPLYAGSE